MEHGFIRAGSLCVLAGLLLTGCSVRHPTLLSATDLAIDQADSLSLDDYLTLVPAEQIARTERAEAALDPLRATEASQDNLDTWLTDPLAWTPYRVNRLIPSLGDVLEHLDAALGLDPVRADLWLARGRLLDVVGDTYRARLSFGVAWEACERVPDRQENRFQLRRDIAVNAAWVERDAGWWDAGLLWIDRLRNFDLDDDAEYQLVHGLLLAGQGELEAAMRLSYGIPPVNLPVVGQMGLEGFLGRKKQKTDLLKRWLQAEVWFRRGQPDLAWHVLGNIPSYRRVVPLDHRLWQELGLYAEISGDGRSNLYYALSYLRRPYRNSYLPVPLTCDPVIRGLPYHKANFYRLHSGSFHGGSLIAYAASSTMLALSRGVGAAADQRYLLAQEALEVCIRRGVYPEEALALRGRLRFSRGYYVLAEVDLAAARSEFARQDDVEPWTSYLLGLIAMGRDRSDEAISLLEEAVGADRDLAGAWNALGVARLQRGERELARLALDRAIELDPHDHRSWFNRGLLRCQSGDLDGGLLDFHQAAQLDPGNERLARVIQLASVAKRDGRAFLPGTDALGAWNPAPVDIHAHEDGEFAPRAPRSNEVWFQHLEQVLDEGMQEAGVLARGDGFDARQLTLLHQEYERDPTPERRKLLAFGFAWHDLPEEAQRVLAPHWGVDLDQDEMLLLLWLDQRTGEEKRLAELAARMRADAGLDFDYFQWASMALNLLGEDPNWNPSKQTTFDRYDAEVRSTSYGAGWGRYMKRQAILINSGAGATLDGGILVNSRGRAIYLTGAARGVGGQPGKK